MIRTILVQYCEKGITQLNSIEWYYLSFLCVLHVSAVKFTIFLSLRFDFFVPVISMKKPGSRSISGHYKTIKLLYLTTGKINNEKGANEYDYNR